MFRNTAIVFLIVILSTVLFAGIPVSGSLYMPVLSEAGGLPVLTQTEEGGETEFPAEEDELFKSEDVKSVKTSFLLSLCVPGAGEFYAGSPIKGAAFLAVEAAAWTGFLILNGKGNDGEDAYRVFADEHWDFDYYYNWFVTFDKPDIYTEQLPVDTVVHISGSDTTLEFIPDKNHDYYEMLGKYDWFVLGWEDCINRDLVRDSTIALGSTEADVIIEALRGGQSDASFRSAWRLEYMNMRKDANDYFTQSKYMIGVAILNHILSAFDAAWTAKRSNDRLYEGFTFNPHFKADVVLDSEGKLSPRVALNLATF